MHPMSRFISAIKQPELAKHGYNPNPPDLAVEVDFPSTDVSRDKLRVKIANYLAAGTVVWVVVVEPKRLSKSTCPVSPSKSSASTVRSTAATCCPVLHSRSKIFSLNSNER